jgi:hypothetical protein
MIWNQSCDRYSDVAGLPSVTCASKGSFCIASVPTCTAWPPGDLTMESPPHSMSVE